MSAAAATWNIICDQGKTLIRSIRYGSKVDDVFTPFDNTGWDARMQVRKNYTSDDIALSASTTAGTIELTGEDGYINLNISASAMTSLNGKYVFDIELYTTLDGVEIVRSPVRGEILVRPEVTR